MIINLTNDELECYTETDMPNITTVFLGKKIFIFSKTMLQRPPSIINVFSKKAYLELHGCTRFVPTLEIRNYIKKWELK